MRWGGAGIHLFFFTSATVESKQRCKHDSDTLGEIFEVSLCRVGDASEVAFLCLDFRNNPTYVSQYTAI